MSERYETRAGVARVIERFGLAPGLIDDQDWALMAVAPERVPELLSSYEEESWDEEGRFALMGWILASLDDGAYRQPIEPEIEARLSSIVARDHELLHDKLAYWARVDEPDLDPADGFAITALMRRLLAGAQVPSAIER